MIGALAADFQPEEPTQNPAQNSIDISQPGVYAEQLHLAYMVAQFLVPMPLDEMVRAVNRAETTVPIFHPTLWLEKSGAMRKDKQVLEILAFAKRQLLKLEEPR